MNMAIMHIAVNIFLFILLVRGFRFAEVSFPSKVGNILKMTVRKSILNIIIHYVSYKVKSFCKSF